MSEKIVIRYAEDHFEKIRSKQDNCRPYGQGPDGYGRKIAMPYLVQFNDEKKWRRVYCTCVSNCGSVWTVARGVTYHFRHDEDLRIDGLWPQEPPIFCKRCGAIATATISVNCCKEHAWSEYNLCDAHKCDKCVPIPKKEFLGYAKKETPDATDLPGQAQNSPVQTERDCSIPS